MRPRSASVSAALVASAALALGLSACGSGGDATTGSASNPQPFTLDLDWYVNPDHAGIYSALDRGFFRQVGLDVQPQVPSDPSAPIKEVAAGRADLAVSYEPEVLLARDQGLDVEAVAAIVNQPLTSLISLPKAGIARGRRPPGQDGRDRRHPVPERLPEDDPPVGGALARRRPRRSTSASTCCPP